MERHSDVMDFNIMITTFGMVKYAPTKLKGTTNNKIMATKARNGVLQKEIPLAVQANNNSTKTVHLKWLAVTYSDPQNCCNVLLFFIVFKTAHVYVRIMLSDGEMICSPASCLQNKLHVVVKHQLKKNVELDTDRRSVGKADGDNKSTRS